jgi:hypothetical protein
MIKFENKTNGRFYYLLVDKDMLDDSVLRVFYGGVGVIRTRTISINNMCEAQKEIDRVAKKRLSRGYSLVT